MHATYITSIGIHTERVGGLESLAAVLEGNASAAAPADRFSKMVTRLDACLAPQIDREDRSVLNDISVSVLNALLDASPLGSAEWPAEHEDMAVFASTDALEYDFLPLAALAAQHATADETVRRLGDLKGLVNPLSMLRHLSTNTTYHVSKALSARGGGYPTQSMSLGGICALEDAVLKLALGSALGRAEGRAVVVVSGNMRSFDSVLVFGKLGLFDAGPGGTTGVVPSHGSGAAMLRRSGIAPSGALAEVIAAETIFSPEPYMKAETWRRVFTAAKRHHEAPDFVVTYANGASGADEVEANALQAIFPNVPTRNYKSLFGYTGKANNLLDLAAILTDRSVPPGAVVLLCGQGFGFGLGTLLFRKLAGKNATILNAPLGEIAKVPS
jgi:hypothetical protein